MMFFNRLYDVHFVFWCSLCIQCDDIEQGQVKQAINNTMFVYHYDDGISVALYLSQLVVQTSCIVLRVLLPKSIVLYWLTFLSHWRNSQPNELTFP